MQENQDKKIYVTIPDKGDYELINLLETVTYLRQLKWTHKTWRPTQALIDKSGGSTKQYVGQNFDPNYFDLVEDGWTHDHCEICFQTISDKESYGDSDGYNADNGDWVCENCSNLFIKPDEIQDTIGSLKTTNK